jgi:hypothetical protein
MGIPMSDSELAAKVRELADRAEIHECMMRYARGMDRRDREVLRSAYHDGAVDDHVGFVGDTAHAETYYLFVGTDREPANHITNSGGRYVDRRTARRPVGDRSQGLRRRMDHRVDVVDHRARDRHAGSGADPDQGSI